MHTRIQPSAVCTVLPGLLVPPPSQLEGLGNSGLHLAEKADRTTRISRTRCERPPGHKLAPDEHRANKRLKLMRVLQSSARPRKRRVRTMQLLPAEGAAGCERARMHHVFAARRLQLQQTTGRQRCLDAGRTCHDAPGRMVDVSALSPWARRPAMPQCQPHVVPAVARTRGVPCHSTPAARARASTGTAALALLSGICTAPCAIGQARGVTRGGGVGYRLAQDQMEDRPGPMLGRTSGARGIFAVS